MEHVDEFLARILAEKQRLAELDWTPPEPPPSPPPMRGAQLVPLTASSIRPHPPAEPLAPVRERLQADVIAPYIQAEVAKKFLIIKLAAGGGKTYAASEYFQDQARAGKRILWCAQRHDAYLDIMRFAHYDHDLWLHWRGRGQLNESGAPMCAHWRIQEHWQHLGYRGFMLCQMLNEGGHCDKNECPYIQQQFSDRRLIFAMHNHLTTGLNLPGFDYAVVDELPYSAFIKNRVIPHSGIPLNVSGPLRALLDVIYNTLGWLRKGKSVGGKELFDKIGPHLMDVYAQYELGLGRLPKTPEVRLPSEVFGMAYWYVDEFLLAALQEYECWRNGWRDWARHVWLDAQGLHILSRADLWDKLPYKLVALDATAEPEFYHMVLDREATTYAPNIERKGRLYQVAHKLYSRNQLYTRQVKVEPVDGKLKRIETILTKPAYTEAVAIIRELAAKHGAAAIGVISYKSLRPNLEAEFGVGHVMHYGALRGSNGFEEVDILFCLGTPSPRFTGVIETTTALNPNHRKPFYVEDEAGRKRPQYIRALREYRLSRAALQDVVQREQLAPDTVGVARITGVCEIDELSVVMSQLREMELVQALNRARFLQRNVPVYLLTSTPLDEELDRLYLNPPLCDSGLHWQTYLRLKPVLDYLPEYTGLWLEDLEAITGISKKFMANNGYIDMLATEFGPTWRTLKERRRPADRKRALMLVKYDSAAELFNLPSEEILRLDEKQLIKIEQLYRTGKLK